jgi:pyruvate dehydrogenase E2 component (dihydrolipoamide acetyltransferase)
MPRYGATMEEGTVGSWMVKEGEQVSRGAVLGEIEIEKLSNELVAEEDGVVLKIVVDAGETVKCGEPIIILGAVGERIEEPAQPQPARKDETPAPASAQPASVRESTPQPTAQYQEAAQITPKGLQLAQELGIDYHYVRGTGRYRMITREDIRAALAAGSLPKAPARPAQAAVEPGAPQPQTRKMSAMQQAIASAMETSLRTTAQTTISMDLDASALEIAYRAHKDAYHLAGVKLTYTTLLVKIVALALVEHPQLRTVIQDGSFVTRGEINVGIAVDVAEGLVVPNIKVANQKDVRQIAVELEDLGARARTNSLSLDEMSGGTFTITNLGMLGIKTFTPVLNPGESGILGVGMLQEVPYARDGGIFVKPIMSLSLTHDHRVVNGAPAARFLQTVQQLANTCDSLFPKG